MSNPKTACALSLILALALLFTSIAMPGAAGAQVLPVVIAPGFQFNLFADPTNVAEFARGTHTGPTALAFDSRGRLFVGTLSGKILILIDGDDNGKVDEVKQFATDVPQPLGLEFRADGELFVTSNRFGNPGKILRLRDLNGDDIADEITTIVDNLPSEGEHQTDRLKFGPDGLLYFGQGSSTDNGTAQPGRVEERPLNAKILRVNVDNPVVEVFASGLRNPFGMAFHPENGELFSTDGGSGELCEFGPCPPEDLSPPEEVNWIVQGGHYGFPGCEGTPTPGNPACGATRAPLTQFLRHLTPTSIAFYTGPQAGADRNQMLVTLFKRITEGGDLRRFNLTGSRSTGFQLTEVLPRIAEFFPIDPGDGPVDTAIDPISGDIYVARLDPLGHRDSSEHHHFIYRIHRAGSDSLPFIGRLRPSAAKAGTGPVTISIVGRHLKPGAVLRANGVELALRQGATSFEMVADLPASLVSSEGIILIEAQNPDGARSNSQTFSVTRTDPLPEPDKSPHLASFFVYKKKRSKVADEIKTDSKAKKLKLVVTGSDFDAGAQLIVGDIPLEIVSRSSTELVGQMVKQLLAVAGELTIQVRNSTGKTSNTLKLTVVRGE